MNKNFTWRIVACIVPVALAALVTAVAWRNYVTDAETGMRFNLGVDLAGGTILVYEVDPEWWTAPQNERLRADFQSADLAAALKRRIDPNNLLEVAIRPIDTGGASPPRVEIVLPMKSAGGGKQGQAEIDRVKNIVSQAGNLEFRLLADTRDERGKDAIDEAKTLTQEFVADEKNVPLAPDGFAWVEISPKEAKELRFGPDSPKGFRMLPGLNTAAVFHAPDVNPPDITGVGRHFVLTEIPLPDERVTGEDMANSRADVGPDGRWEVHFSMKPAGGEKFYELTKRVHHFMAIILDDRIVSYPELQSRLRDNGRITMSGTGAELKRKVDDLVLVLRSGALPATLKSQPVSELSMGPGLGQDTIEKGTIAVIVALIGVVAFMILYYRMAGLIASVALFANLLLTVGFMIAVKATFTLPGLAGLVLMLGMAVDANVLIYERIREERERGGSLLLAIRNGYDRAFPTIIDTHLTSIFTAVVLYVVGNDQLKGFGVSLTAGLIISLFTSLYMTRLMFDLLLAGNLLGNLHMMKLPWGLAKPNFDYMRVRNYWFTATAVLALLGLAVFAWRGTDGLNIDFTGGTAYSVEFKEPRSIHDVRTAIADSGLENPAVDAIYPGATAGAGLTRHYTFRTTLKDRDKVRKIVADTFKDDLVWVEVDKGELKDVPPARPNDPPRKSVELTFAGKAVAPSEVAREVEAWFKDKGEPRPSDFYTVAGVGEPQQGGIFQKILLTLTMPEGTRAEDLVAHLTPKGGPLYQPKSERLENFDSQLAGETQLRALYAVVASWGAICLYLWVRFGSWTFGLAAVLCLVHDLLFAMGLIALSHYLAITPVGGWLMLEDFKLDLPAVAALLTLVGYSVNDTIVVFDRIKEVRGKSPELTAQMINDSVNQTLSRTLLTAFIVWIVVMVLYIFGGEGIHLFSFVMVVGVIVGCYSSIFVASPLLLIFGEGKQPERVRGRAVPQEVGV